MKKVVLLVAGLVLFSIPLFAGEYLMNDTGETVYGLRVVFSEPVELTGFGDVLMAVAPAGESTEFVFFGGELGSWAGHWFNWEPGSAFLVNHQWLTDPATVKTAASDWAAYEASRPFWERNPNPTYEEIMAEIAEYPGPDEPLYEPAPDEAIWLTDLEGHANIYDNDSIKINYAEWFDKDQITKIEVYRNGIKMRFLPDTFDVLTNKQMKTFDGNPLEHTPASNHTDHAICGYEYRVVVFAAAGSVEQTTLIRAPFAVSGSYKYADLLSTWNWAVAADWMTDFAVKEYIEGLAQLGFNGIYFDVVLFAQDDHRAEFFPQYECDPAVSPEWMLTALDGDILDVLDWISEAGLNAELGVQLYVIPYGSGANGYRSFVHPDNVAEWFSAYTDRVLHYARLAEQGGAKIFRPVVEFNTMQRETEQMKGLLDAVRRVFSGDLMVAESTNHYIYNMADFYSATFWDYPGLTLGLNCWTPTMEVQKDQRLSYMAQRFVSDWQPVIAQYRNEFPDTPIVFSEMGWFNFDGSVLGVAADPSSGPRDDQEMADAWAAYLIAVEFLQLDGVNVWTFGVASPHASHGGSVVNDSSALPIIGSLLGGTPMYYLPVDKLAQPSD